jgi:hypothetical protein
LLQNAALAYLLLVTSPYEALAYPILLLIAASICHATSNVTFSGGGYDISVLLSDEDCKVVGLNVTGDNPNIISISANELTAFNKAESDCRKKQSISWCPKRNLIPISN